MTRMCKKRHQKLPQLTVCDEDCPWQGVSQPVTPSCFRVALMGLDGAGKTSLLCAERLGSEGPRLALSTPTHDTDVEMVHVKGKSALGPFRRPSVDFAVFDFGGDRDHRTQWASFKKYGSLIIYVVDSIDVARLPEAADQLAQILRQSREDMREGRFLHFCVLANKQDHDGALPPVEIAKRLNVASMPFFFKVYGVSSYNKHPLREVLRDLMYKEARALL
jgi:GTPase SAR1 family protein